MAITKLGFQIETDKKLLTAKGLGALAGILSGEYISHKLLPQEKPGEGFIKNRIASHKKHPALLPSILALGTYLTVKK